MQDTLEIVKEDSKLQRAGQVWLKSSWPNLAYQESDNSSAERESLAYCFDLNHSLAHSTA